jgi:hypothetical protein
MKIFCVFNPHAKFSIIRLNKRPFPWEKKRISAILLKPIIFKQPIITASEEFKLDSEYKSNLMYLAERNAT